MSVKTLYYAFSEYNIVKQPNEYDIMVTGKTAL